MKKKTTLRFPIVLVVWDDAEGGGGGWTDVPEELHHKLVTTVGFLVKQTDSHILLCMDYEDDGGLQIAGKSQIPIGMVQSIKYITKYTLSKGASDNDTKANTSKAKTLEALGQSGGSVA